MIIYLNTKTIFISRNVTHHDHVLPYCNPSQPFTLTYHSDQDVTLELVITTSHDQDHRQAIDTSTQNIEEHIPIFDTNETELAN